LDFSDNASLAAQAVVSLLANGPETLGHKARPLVLNGWPAGSWTRRIGSGSRASWVNTATGRSLPTQMSYLVPNKLAAGACESGNGELAGRW
jgi:hypothetical protein